MATPANKFNGGKQGHVFGIGDENLYTGQCASEETAKILADPQTVFFWKIDGSNMCIFMDAAEDGTHELTLYQRYDDKKGKVTPQDLESGKYRVLAEGPNPSKYNNHVYYYTPVPKPDDPSLSKKQRKMSTALYDAVNRSRDMVEKLCETHGFCTVEAVGRKFNKTPEVSDIDFGLAPHELQIADVPQEARTFEGIRDLLLKEYAVEGVVLRSVDGKCLKIRSNCMSKKDPFTEFKKTGSPPEGRCTVSVVLF